MEIARKEVHVVIPSDTDFRTIAFRYNLLAFSGIILFRLTLVSPTAVAEAVLETLQSCSD